MRPASRWVWCSSSMPMRNLTVTGISVPSAARTAAPTIWPNSRRLNGSAAPPPRLVTLGTGQPKVTKRGGGAALPFKRRLFGQIVGALGHLGHRAAEIHVDVVGQAF